MLCFLEDVIKWVDKGSPLDIIYLEVHGIGNGMINWIEKWLIDTRQRVIVEEEVSY